MASIGQIYHNILDNGSGSFISSSVNDSYIDIFSDIISQVVSSSGSQTPYFSKIGVQAPPGSQIVLNDSKTVIVGRTGIYDLDNVKIESMYFIRPKYYIKNEEETLKSLRKGEVELFAAWNEYLTKVNGLTLDYGTMTDAKAIKREGDYVNFIAATEEYQAAYKSALLTFNEGHYGQYEIDPTKTGDLYHVIVDYLYELN